MKNLICTGLLIVAANFASGQSTGTAADEKAVRQTIDAMMTSWKNHSYADIANWTTPDVDWVNSVGMWWKGRSEMQQAHQAYHDTMFRNTGSRLEEVTIRFVTADVAIVHLLSHLDAFYPPDGIDHGSNKRPESDDMATLVFVKRNSKWLLTAGENIAVNKQATASNPVAKPRK